MKTQQPDLGRQSPARDSRGNRIEDKLRKALDIALIAAMAAAPFLLVTTRLDEGQIGANAESQRVQLAQMPAP